MKKNYILILLFSMATFLGHAQLSTNTTSNESTDAQGGSASMTISMDSATDNFSTLLLFNTIATNGLDVGFDTSGPAPADFSIFTVLVEGAMGETLAIQALNFDALADTTIPLGVRVFAGEEITLSMSASVIPPTTEVFLEDTQEGTTTLLNTDSYTTTPAVNLNGTGRFFLRVNDDTLSTPESTLEESLEILSLKAERTILIKGQLSKDNRVELYDMQGRLVLSQNLDHNTSQNRIDASSIGTGVFVINIQSGSQQISQKLVIN